MMGHRTRSAGAALVMCVLVLSIAGCGENAKERIAMLEQDNEALANSLNDARMEIDRVTVERDGALDDLGQAQAEIDRLRTQLAAKPAEPENLPAQWQPVPGGAMIAIDGEVLFDSGKTLLKQTCRSTLDRLASEVRASFPNHDIYVIGHTDNDPIRRSGWKDNYELSCQRSLSVVRYLGAKGVESQRMIACGWGEHHPRIPNTSRDTKRQNRRVEIFALDQSITMATR